jgi:predicted lipoprotein with Yx(FWY)xxD motif
MVVLGAASALLAACGSTSSPSTGNVKGATGTNTPAGTSSPATAATAAVVAVAMVTVKGTSEQVLTATNGDTLYYLTKDTATNASCTGSCAGVWPPLLLASGQPTASSSLPEALSVVNGANGRQVEYDGHPVYTYSGDSGPDQSNGQGVSGVWFVVTPTMSSATASSATPTPTVSAPGGY